MRTIVYVDWFNLYYGVIKSTPFWWLDIHKLVSSILKPNLEITNIKLFTADLLPKLNNKPAIVRQATYHSALSHHCPIIEIFKGEFIPKTIQISCLNSGKKNKICKYSTFEEKGTDVNLALHMLNDSWLDLYDLAILISNDSDFAGALELVKKQNNKDVGLLTPGRTNATYKLWNLAKFHHRITLNQLEQCQLPTHIPNSSIIKPRR